MHLARIQKDRGHRYLYLMRIDQDHFIWIEENELGDEIETSVLGATFTEALRNARSFWKKPASFL